MIRSDWILLYRVVVALPPPTSLTIPLSFLYPQIGLLWCQQRLAMQVNPLGVLQTEALVQLLR